MISPRSKPLPDEKSSTASRRLRAVDVAELVFLLAFLFWLMLAVQDWLLSSVETYPYAASVWTDAGLLAGLLCFLRVLRLTLWRNVVLTGGALLCVLDVLRLIPQGLGAVPAVAALTCALAVAPLCSIGLRFSSLRHWLYAAALFAGAVAILRHAREDDRPLWGVLTVVVSIGASTLFLFAAWLRRKQLNSTDPASRKKLSRIAAVVALLLFAGMMTLLVKIVLPFDSLVPSVSPTTSRITVWIGGALGRYSFPTYWPGTDSFAPLLSAEWGILALWVLGAMIVAALAAGALVLWGTAGVPQTEVETRLELCAGAVGGLAGMLLGAHLAPPFLTSESVGGTWAFASAIAAAGLAATSRAGQVKSVRHASAAPQEMAKPRRTVAKRAAWWAIGVIALALACALIVSFDSLRRLIAPFAGSGSPPGLGASYVALADIAQPMRDATVAMEDGRFYQHGGIDWKAVHRALRINLRAGRVRQGGSTITQQLVKNLFLSEDRTLARKFQEAVVTLEIERQLPKARILELYLNVVDYGMKQRGVGAAARHYFHKKPSQLTLAESAVLVGIVPDPPQRSLPLERFSRQRETALQRIAARWSSRYSPEDIEKAELLSIYRLVYPSKLIWDRGATDQIPALWHGINFYYVPAAATRARPIYNVSPILKPPLAAFLEEASERYQLVGLGHKGIYAARLMRASASALSAHAFGQAIDIADFRFADGSIVRVRDHADPRVAARLAPWRALLQKHFDLVVDWRADPKHHQDHFHAEVKGERNNGLREAA